jgi:hypothetical protein
LPASIWAMMPMLRMLAMDDGMGGNAKVRMQNAK